MTQHYTPPALMRAAAVAAALKVNETTLYRWVKNGDFPQPLRMSTRKVYWTPDQLHGWLASKQPTD